ncbi:thymidine phosphorylase family protein [Shewanella salipaludis]|uniref:Putative thymidine phosphorylase n=1 Tax=Shewanella salipaludis TaxID=2723052 RepID=A0A972JJK3_9GAMM|nr:thymidine phosphorylase family protein [Shewanella salipaludis]NMH65240.1 thymidine phosphorylase family protein [Shewanella salipaludis]
MQQPTHSLVVVDMGIDTHQEPVVYMRRDCHVCKAEGFNASRRVVLSYGDCSLIATLNVTSTGVLKQDQVGLSKIAMQRLKVKSGDRLCIQHAPVLASLGLLRKKIFGNKLTRAEFKDIIQDISTHGYRDMEIASFLTICAGGRLDIEEIISLTQAMVESGKRLSWPGHERIFDKHCIGGLPGNRTTPIVVAIVSAAGHIIPKTSSRAITSPAGTADTMGALTNVSLKMADIQAVVAKTCGCLAWGGAVNLSPADDLLIRLERVLDLDGEGQLIASVLSKKIAAGSTHALIDIPVGDTAKVRTRTDAERLASLFTRVGSACNIRIRCVITDGSKPVGYGIGPVEEARDLLSVLQCQKSAPQDLRERALLLAAELLDLAENSGLDEAMDKARSLLDSGRAYQQFMAIIAAQGGLKSLPQAHFHHDQHAQRNGRITAIDNRKLARLAKLAGAPFSPAAGLRLRVNVGDTIHRGQTLFRLFSDSTGELDYALQYYLSNLDIFTLEDA